MAMRDGDRRSRSALLPLLLVLCLMAAVPVEAAGAPQPGRWVGTRADGMRVSFVVQAVGGQRYLSGVTWLCDRGRPIADSEDVAGVASYAWRLDRRGRIRANASGQHRRSALSGRLGRGGGTVRLDAVAGDCRGPETAGLRVRRIGGWLVQSGLWRLSESAYGSALDFRVLGSAVVAQAHGTLRVPRAQGPWPDIGGTTCTRTGHGVFPDAWIAPGNAFSARDAQSFAITAAFFTSRRADGSYAQGEWNDPRCSTQPVGFCIRLVQAQPRPRAGRRLLPAPEPHKLGCPPDRARENRCCLP